MDKRKKFIIVSIILAIGFFGMQFVQDQFFRFASIGLLSIATTGLFVWALKEGLGKDSTLLVLILPTMYTLGVGLFWFLLPVNFITRIPVVIIFGFGIYALCLTSNIFTVAAIRTIALARAARGVGFVLTLFTCFLLFDAILSLRANLVITAAVVGLVSFPLFLQGFWTIPLTKSFDKILLTMSAISSLVMIEIAASMHFWPTKVVVGSLFFTIAVYMLLGLGQVKLEARLFTKTVREYLAIGFFVFIGMLIATSWGG